MALSSPQQKETTVKMSDSAVKQSTAGQRLGAPESFGVSTLEPGLHPPTQPPGRQVSIRVQMLDDTQEVFQISVSNKANVCYCGCSNCGLLTEMLIHFLKNNPELNGSLVS